MGSIFRTSSCGQIQGLALNSQDWWDPPGLNLSPKVGKKWILRVFLCGRRSMVWSEFYELKQTERNILIFTTFTSILCFSICQQTGFLQTGLVQTGLYPVNRFARTGYKPVWLSDRVSYDNCGADFPRFCSFLPLRKRIIIDFKPYLLKGRTFLGGTIP